MTKNIAKNLVHAAEMAFYKKENKCEEALPKYLAVWVPVKM